MNIGGCYMLYVYDDINDIPADKKFINNAEAWFQDPKETTKEIDIILKDVEKAKFFSDRYFTDRFGGNVYWSCLSTGSKTAILAVMQKDWVIDCTEAGYNVMLSLVSNNLDASIYVPRLTMITALECCNAHCDIMYKGEKFNNIKELYAWRRYGHK